MVIKAVIYPHQVRQQHLNAFHVNCTTSLSASAIANVTLTFNRTKCPSDLKEYVPVYSIKFNKVRVKFTSIVLV